MRRSGKRAAPATVLFIGVAATAALWLGAGAAPHARAAPCPVPTFGMDGEGNVSIQGTPPCAEEPEVIKPFCSEGTIAFDYGVNGIDLGATPTGLGCGAATRLLIRGNQGDDLIDLSRVGNVLGFTGLAQRSVIDGGEGNDMLVGGPFSSEVLAGRDNDIVLVRNGIRDPVECGDGIDAVQTDEANVDPLNNCEVVDLIATIGPEAPTVAKQTGRRAAALKKCKRKKHRRARRRCIRRARKLPV